MTIAFALCGGGSAGAVQVGMLRALTESGIRPDFVVGSSVGAINGAYYAADPTADGLSALELLWRQLGHGTTVHSDPVRRLHRAFVRSTIGRIVDLLGISYDVFPPTVSSIVSLVRGRSNHVCRSHQLRSLLRQSLPVTRLDLGALPMYVVATDAATGRAVILSKGDSVSALLASAAIPVLLPPVDIEGTTLIDGDIADRTVLDVAVDLGATDIFLLAGTTVPDLSVPNSATRMLAHTFRLMNRNRMSQSVIRAAHARVHLVPSPDVEHVLPTDFNRTHEFVDHAYELTRRWLRSNASADLAV